MKRWLIFLLVFVNSVALGQNEAAELALFFEDYVSELKRGDYNAAASYWAVLDRTRADELRVSYPDAPFKLEMESVLGRYLPELQAGKASVSVADLTFSRDYVKIDYSLAVGAQQIDGTHYAIVRGVARPTLVTPQRVFTESWDETQSEYCRLHYRDQTLLSPQALTDIDSFVETTARKLGIPNEKLVVLSTIKFNVYLCGSYGEVKQVTGRDVMGHFAISGDAVVSRHCPPYHEISQFLVNYANPGIESATLPFLQYGTATFLAGRWGRSADVLLSLGAYIYLNDLIELDSLIEGQSFEAYESNPDFSYPIAGLFCKFLFETLGREKYFQFYRGFSGSAADVEKITLAQFRDSVVASLDREWPKVVTDFETFVRLNNYAGIAAGSLDKGKVIFESGLPGILVRILEDGNQYHFHIRSQSRDPRGALAIGRSSGAYKSFLFNEQFPDTTYDGQHYGVIFTAMEAGTYNYLTNEITGKYIEGVTGEAPLTDGKSSIYRFRIEKTLLGDLSVNIPRLMPLK